MAATLIALATPSMNTPLFEPPRPVNTATRALAASLPGAESIPFFMPASTNAGVFDPLNCIPETEAELMLFREAEVMHGRVAMIGTLGYLVQSHFHPLFETSGQPVIRHLDLVLATENGQAAGAVLLSMIFLTEITRAKVGWVEPEVEMRSLRQSYTPGDLGFDPLGLKPKTERELKLMQDKEIRNGRLAMLAIAGMTVQELTTGQEQVTAQFNQINGLQLICRAHQLVQEGYKYMFPMKNLITVWSAPNYCYRCGNVASILAFNDQLDREVKIFKDVPESGRPETAKSGIQYFL